MRRPRASIMLMPALMVACGGDGQTARPRSSPTPTSTYTYTYSPTPPPTPLTTPSPPVSDGDGAPRCNRNTIDCLERLGDYLAAGEGYSGMAARAFTLAYQICAIYPVAEVARQYDSANDPISAAEAYADETFVEAVQPAGFSGCLSGFQGKP